MNDTLITIIGGLILAFIIYKFIYGSKKKTEIVQGNTPQIPEEIVRAWIQSGANQVMSLPEYAARYGAFKDNHTKTK